MSAWRGEKGSAPIELVAGFGWLVLPVALLVLSLPGWMETQSMARTAAREAARAVVLAPDPTGADATQAGETAAMTVAGNYGQQLARMPEFTFGTEQAVANGSARSQEWVTARVTVRMPALSVPFVARWAAFDWTVEHTEPVDVYRSRP